MTKKQVRSKTSELIRNCSASMRKNIEKVLESGAVNIGSYEDNYLLPKIILVALLKEEIFQYEPHSEKRKIEKEINNIYAHI